MISRKFISALLGIYCLFILYSTFIPFHFASDTISFKFFLKMFLRPDTQPYGLSKSDMLSNVLLFVPFGFLLFAWIGGRTGSRLMWLIPAISLIGGVFSFVIELGQMFAPDRVSSILDVLTNMAGSVFGAAMGFVYFRSLHKRIVPKCAVLVKQQPLALVLVFLVVLQVLAATLPFYVTIDVSTLRESVKASHMMPFQHQPIRGSANGIQFDAYTFAENILYFSLFGLLLLFCYFEYWRKQISFANILTGALLFHPAMEIMQVFIVGRVADINDILSGWMGMFLGMFGYLIIRFMQDTRNDQHIFRTKRGLFVFLLVVYCSFLIFTNLKPFDFDPSLSAAKSRLESVNWLPFYAYFQRVSYLDLMDLCETVLYLFPVGFYMGMRRYKHGSSRNGGLIFAITFGLVIGVVFEATQLFLISRTSDITDVISFALGCALGFKIDQLYLQYWSDGIRHPYREPIGRTFQFEST